MLADAKTIHNPKLIDYLWRNSAHFSRCVAAPASTVPLVWSARMRYCIMTRSCQSVLMLLRHCAFPPSLKPIGSPAQCEFACIGWTQSVTCAVFAPTQICRPQNLGKSTTALGFGALASCKPFLPLRTNSSSLAWGVTCVGGWALSHSRAAPPRKFAYFQA